MRSAFAGERKALSSVVPTVGASAMPRERRVTSARVPKPRPAASPPKDIMRPSREAGTDRWRAISFNCLTTAHWFLLCLWYQCVVLMLLRHYENEMIVPRLKAFGVSNYLIYYKSRSLRLSHPTYSILQQLNFCPLCTVTIVLNLFTLYRPPVFS